MITALDHLQAAAALLDQGINPLTVRQHIAAATTILENADHAAAELTRLAQAETRANGICQGADEETALHERYCVPAMGLASEIDRLLEWSNDLALLIPEDLQAGNPEGAQESIIEDTLRYLVGVATEVSALADEWASYSVLPDIPAALAAKRLNDALHGTVQDGGR